MTKSLILMAALLLSACNHPSFNREAGDMDTGDFGNATMHNNLVAMGRIQAPMGPDKYDAPRPGTQLSGLYAAQVINNYYTTTAAREHPSNTQIVTQTNPAGN